MNMPLENREGQKEFNIRPDWYRNRKSGISAMIRCGNEEKWIIECLKSILYFFDEIIVTVGPVGTKKDGTMEIVEGFRKGLPGDASWYSRVDAQSKLQVYDYPFSLREKDPPPDSVNDKSYYYNWTLSLTHHQVVAKWDVDMLMIHTMEGMLRRLAEKKNVLRLKGYNVVEENPYYLSAAEPIEHYEPRFFKINKYIHYVQAPSYMPKPVHGREMFTYDAAGLIPNPRLWYAIKMPKWLYMYRAWNAVMRKDMYLKTPAFIHTKYLKLKEEPDSSWCPERDERLRKGKKLEL